MKRTIFLRIFTFLLFLTYIFLTFLSGNIEILIPFNCFWFSNFILILGLSLFIRYLCYHIDSTLFSGVFLLLSGGWGIFNYYFNFNVPLVFSGYLLALAIAFLSVFIKFRQIFHAKAFAFIGLYVIVLIMYSIKLLPLWLFISLLGVTSIILAWTVFINIKTNMRKV